MPQIYDHQLAAHTQLVLWHLTEPEGFFSSVASGTRPIAHPHKRLQHLCGRFLLQMLVPGFPLAQIVAEHHNKPFLPNHPYHFSISHCDDYVAAMVSTSLRVGIDVETIGPKVAAIRRKFLTREEQAMLSNTELRMNEIEKLTLAWSAKETMFKWLGESGVDFKKQLVLENISPNTSHSYLQAAIKRQNTHPVEIYFRQLEGVMLTWLAN